jgi:hypothetical protein
VSKIADNPYPGSRAFQQADYARFYGRGADSATHPGDRARWRQQFLAELTQACDDQPRLHLLLVVRSQVLDLLRTAFGGGARYPVTRLAVQAAVEAITGPALGAGRPL